MLKRMPWSSSGASSFCDVMYMIAVAAMTPIKMSSVTGRAFSVRWRRRW